MIDIAEQELMKKNVMPAVEIKKSDWKLFRERLPEAREK